MRESVVPLFARKIPGTSGITSLSWDIMGCGCYYTDYENSSVTWDMLWQSDILDTSRVRGQLYSHSFFLGAAFEHITCLCDGHALIGSCGSDGTVRVGFTALLASLRPPGQGLMEVMRIVSLQKNEEASSSSSSLRSTIVSIDRHLQIADLDNRDMARLCYNSGVRLHGIDVMLTADKESPDNMIHMFAYGGECGIVRVHSMDILSSLLQLPVTK